MRLRYILGTILAVSLLTAALGSYGIWYYNNRQGSSIFTSLWVVEVTAKGISSDRVPLYWLDIQIPEMEATALGIPLPSA